MRLYLKIAGVTYTYVHRSVLPPTLQLVTKMRNARHVETSIRIDAHVWYIKYVSGTAKTGKERRKTAGSNQFGIQRSDHPKREKSWQPNSTISVLYPTSCTLVGIKQENKKPLQNLLISGAQSNGTITLLVTEYCRYGNRLLAFAPSNVFLFFFFYIFFIRFFRR